VGGFVLEKPSRRCDSFIKLENYDEFKEARWINSRSDKFKVIAGPMFKIVEDALYQDHHFIKHVPVPDRPALIAALVKGGCRYFSTDYTAFESHFTDQIMHKLELKLYTHVLKYCADVESANSVISGINHLQTRLGWSFSVLARRMSGDMCTSCGNGFSNLMLALFIAKERDMYIDGYVEGDDGIFAVTGELKKEDYEKLGWTIKIQECDHPYAASFCGNLCSPDGYVLKNPRHVFRSFGWTSSFLRGKETTMMGLCNSKAISLVYELSQCPILGVLGRVTVERCAGVEPIWLPSYKQVPVGFKIPPFAPTDVTREAFAHLFGISVPAQLECERHIQAGDLAHLATVIPPTPDDVWYHDRYIEVD
jgi:hypothetical protein